MDSECNSSGTIDLFIKVSSFTRSLVEQVLIPQLISTQVNSEVKDTLVKECDRSLVCVQTLKFHLSDYMLQKKDLSTKYESKAADLISLDHKPAPISSETTSCSINYDHLDKNVSQATQIDRGQNINIKEQVNKLKEDWAEESKNNYLEENSNYNNSKSDNNFTEYKHLSNKFLKTNYLLRFGKIKSVKFCINCNTFSLESGSWNEHCCTQNHKKNGKLLLKHCELCSLSLCGTQDLLDIYMNNHMETNHNNECNQGVGKYDHKAGGCNGVVENASNLSTNKFRSEESISSNNTSTSKSSHKKKGYENKPAERKYRSKESSQQYFKKSLQNIHQVEETSDKLNDKFINLHAALLNEGKCLRYCIACNFNLYGSKSWSEHIHLKHKQDKTYMVRGRCPSCPQLELLGSSHGLIDNYLKYHFGKHHHKQECSAVDESSQVFDNFIYEGRETVSRRDDDMHSFNNQFNSCLKVNTDGSWVLAEENKVREINIPINNQTLAENNQSNSMATNYFITLISQKATIDVSQFIGFCLPCNKIFNDGLFEWNNHLDEQMHINLINNFHEESKCDECSTYIFGDPTLIENEYWNGCFHRQLHQK